MSSAVLRSSSLPMRVGGVLGMLRGVYVTLPSSLGHGPHARDSLRGMRVAIVALYASLRTEVAGCTARSFGTLLGPSCRLVYMFRTVGQYFSSKVAAFQLIRGSKWLSQGYPNIRST